jgi:hypothetical protein
MATLQLLNPGMENVTVAAYQLVALAVFNRILVYYFPLLSWLQAAQVRGGCSRAILSLVYPVNMVEPHRNISGLNMEL